MPVYSAPLENIRFVLHEVLNVETLSELSGFEDVSKEVVDQILDEGAKLCEEVLFPLNQSGDEQGCVFDSGAVKTPKGFKPAYDTFLAGGWPGLAADPEYGGMGLPVLLNTVMQEIICSANMSFGTYPGLTRGAYEAIHKFGDDDLKRVYLPNLVEGTWSGTMCLTESHCGTDLGLIKAKAEPDKNGSYLVSGTKIFISAGEHDLTDNIVHLVLARLPNAPDGIKGISLFVVPKFVPQEEEGKVKIGERNNVHCGSIEHKMGIKASSTAVLNFDNAKGWIVGEPNEGLKAMFTMMNDARLGVAMQGLGIAEVAYQNALAYAKERLQMRALKGAQAPEKPADPIIVHPDVRRMLLTSKAFCEGARALSYWTSMKLAIADHHSDKSTRQEADDFVALLTPVLKAYQTDMGFEVANLAIQVYGGHGYIREHGIEQYARDIRIAMIYEGTNGIQALDLVGRKMSLGYGRLLRRFFHPLGDFIQAHQDNIQLQEFIFPLAKAYSKLQQATAMIAQKGLKNPDEAGAASVDYLHMFALVAMGYIWVRMALVSLEKLDNDPNGREVFYQSKIDTARFFFAKMLPETDSRFKVIIAGAESVMNMPQESF